MSNHSANEFGLRPESNRVGCIGSTPESFKDCILSIHGSESQWNELHTIGRTFIPRIHNRSDVKENWANVISMAENKYIEVKAVEEAEDLEGGYITHNLFSTESCSPQRPCSEGESLYR